MKLLTPVLCALILLGGCTAGKGTSIAEQNRNPLTASRYGDELADRMASIVIGKDPVADDAGTRKAIDEAITNGKELSATARMRQSEGMLGGFIGMKQGVYGFGLLLGTTFYTSSDFASDPGIDLHLYLTTVVDPRDIQFPDPTALDLGPLQSVYGAQEYTLEEDSAGMRTAVIWDRRLKRLYGFAQLSK